MKTRTLTSGRARVIIGEHSDSCYLALGVDSASIGAFLSADECAQIAVDMTAIAERIRDRSEQLPPASNPS